MAEKTDRRGNVNNSSSATLDKKAWSRPLDWLDEDRMHFLLAPFPPGTDSVSVGDAKFAFWSKLLVKSTTELNKVSFSLAELEERFQWNSIRPKSLQPIVVTMEENGLLVKADDSLKHIQTHRKGIASNLLWWGANAVSSSVSWTWRKMYGSNTNSSAYLGKYLLVDRLKEVCMSVYSSHNRSVVYKKTDNVLSISDFTALCQQFCGDQEEILWIQVGLIQQGLLCLSTTNGVIEAVKFAPSLQEKLQSFSEADTAIMVLKETISHITEQLSHHKDQADRLYAVAKSEAKAKRSKNAQVELRKSLVERKRASRAQSKIDNMEQILDRIRQVESDTMVMEAYAGGLEAMRTALHSMPMSREELEDVMDRIQDLGQEQEEITSGLHLPAAFTEDGDDELDDLEQELNRLCLTEKSSKPAVPGPGDPVQTADKGTESASGELSDSTTAHTLELIANLPQVPTHSPKEKMPPKCSSVTDKLVMQDAS